MDIDSQYFDKNGDHIHYERSLIEKKLFRQKFPHNTNLRKASKNDVSDCIEIMTNFAE